METETLTTPLAVAIPPELDADTRAVLDQLATGRPISPEARARIRRDADRVRAELLRRHGVLDIGVPALRALRDA